MTDDAQLSNSFIRLLALRILAEPFSTTQISQYIARKTKWEILKVSGTIKDSMERRLKKAGYVEGVDIPSKKNDKKPIRVSLYKITPKGKRGVKVERNDNKWMTLIKNTSKQRLTTSSEIKIV